MDRSDSLVGAVFDLEDNNKRNLALSTTEERVSELMGIC
jgi:hypothetical protein